MQWLKRVVDEVVSRHPSGDILIESGSSPSGEYHIGSLRELLTCDAILLELKNRGTQAKHISYIDDLDALRKVPANIPPEYEKYLGMPLSDIPAPDGSQRSYADFFVQDLKDAAKALSMEVEFIHTHQKYRSGFFGEAIERSLEREDKIRPILEKVSGHKLGEEWSPIQINEGGYLKKRKFLSIDAKNKVIQYKDSEGNTKSTPYSKGEVKLDWRIDWPARWWLLDVNVEPFGRDHATKGGSFDTGAALSREVFDSDPPLPVPYDFVNLAGDTKKMSASRGTGVGAKEAVEILPPEVVRFFMLRYPPSKRLYLDTQNIHRLIDEYEEFVAKSGKSEEEHSLLQICQTNLGPTVSSVPFSHLVASYQASLKNPDTTIELLKRNTQQPVDEQAEVIKQQLKFVDKWLQKWAPEEVKFEIKNELNPNDFRAPEKEYFAELAEKTSKAPPKADGEWFHKAIYDIKEAKNLSSEEVFKPLYRLLIGKDSGPRAGWFLSILPRDWLIKRLKMEE